MTADEGFDDMMRDSTEAAGPVSRERADRFYDRMRESIRNYLSNKGSVTGAAGEYLLLAPDVFVLLWRLVNDSRVNAKNKVMLGSGLAYYVFPLDIMPEGLMGPLGYIDDLVFGVYLLNKLLTDTDPAILREHWSGRDDILASITNVLTAADNLVGSDIIGKFKKTMK
ncbi:MAG TPA: DUF1232 domain-containing protein [Thermoanaerobaculia bacterium]|nr:DUF1232 domain-containing protein [Thermoanaerobaculia bacterium]